VISVISMTESFLGKDGLVARSSGDWIESKFHYLRRYLNIFSVAMKNKWELYYVDLFAGPGLCKIRETQEEINGSPLIALLENDFDKYYFFEADPDCFQALTKRIQKQAPDKIRKTQLIPGDCNTTINQINPPTNGLGVAFIDPTGLSPLTFETIRKLSFNRKIDLIINFHDGMGIRMNLHQYTKNTDTALDAFMGSNRWQQKRQQKLMSFEDICREIVNEYMENLRDIGYLAFGNEMVPVTTKQNSLLYYLLFASKHPKGNEFWRKIGLIDPQGQRRFPGL
jgi:three-Cys-motif partner protein